MWKHSRQMTVGLVFVVILASVGSGLTLGSSPDSNTVSKVCYSKGQCNEFCGKTCLQYPFYIKSSACGRDGFRLQCYKNSTLSIELNNIIYNVTSVDTSGIVLDVLQYTCSPNLESFNMQNLQNYAISKDNYIQLYNCKNRTHCRVRNCNIPYMNYKSFVPCEITNPCCYSLRYDTVWPPGQSNFDRFAELQCSAFTSWAIARGKYYSTSVGLKLEWGILGDCNKFQCHPNAYCNAATDMKGGVRCTCNSGFVGDGYVEGSGCIKVCTKDNKLLYEGDCEEKWNRGRIAILASVFVAAASLVGGIVFYKVLLIRRRRRNSLDGPGQGRSEKTQLGNEGEEYNTELFTYKTLYHATKGFGEAQKCGYGSCGTVYAGFFADGRHVAIKRMNSSNSSSQQGVRQLLNEISLLSNIKHPNLIQLLGCCLEAKDPILVYEFVPNGILSKHLHHELMDGKLSLDWRTRCAIAADAAGALAYLHDNLNPPIYHRDVKSSNILLDFNFNCKVGDFGLSRLAPFDGGTHISTAPQGTPGYLDPDYYETYRLTDKSDVYSFGVVLIEIITGMKPVDLSRGRKEINLATLAVAKITAGFLDDIIDPSLRVACQPHVRALVQRVAELAFRCLAYDKDARPTMKEVAQELLAIQKENDDMKFEDLLSANNSETITS